MKKYWRRLKRAFHAFVLPASCSLILCGCSLADNISILGTRLAPQAYSSAFTWMGGSNLASQAAYYGTVGVSNAANNPGVRDSSASWTDAAGNFWLFGGLNSTTGFLNDLWKFNPSSGQWTWMGGSNLTGQAGVYGTLGVAAPTNIPGSRYAPMTWTDHSGRLWMFGGKTNASATSPMNDLWVYDPSTGMWTWMGGSQTYGALGVYGTVKVSAASNVPTARDSAATWVDSSGNFWMFGGYGFGHGGGLGYLNDLWEYNPTSGLWTWMSGVTSIGSAGVYGTLGVSAAANVPSARARATTWVDSSNQLWMFGGINASLYNDLWMYSEATGYWTWVSGSNSTNKTPVYGVLGAASTSYVPGSSYGLSWKDSSGNFWYMSEYGYDSTGAVNPLNTIWKFSPSSLKWAWMGDSQTGTQPGSYGTLGQTAASNAPGSRGGVRTIAGGSEWDSAASWLDANGNFWLFGGYGVDSTGTVGMLSDLWSYSIPTSAVPVIVGSANLQAGASTTYSVYGGQAPYVFLDLAGGGSIDANSGVFTAPGHATTVVISVTDSLGQTVEALLTINKPPLSLSISSNTDSYCGQRVNLTASGGALPYTYSVASGAGSINSATGVYSSPMSIGTGGVVTLQVRDASNSVATTAVTLTVPSSPSCYILDTTPGATAAYGLRQLTVNYTGKAINVRRSSDNANMDIGFDASGNFDTGTYSAFVGASTGYVVTWYDQSGNARNITQSTVANQPTLLLNAYGSSPGVLFKYANQTYLTASFPWVSGAGTWTVHSVMLSNLSDTGWYEPLFVYGNVAAANNQSINIGAEIGGIFNWCVGYYGVNINSNTATSGPSAVSGWYDGSSIWGSINGSTFSSAYAAANVTATVFTMGGSPLQSGIWLNGTISEMILYPSNLTPTTVSTLQLNGRNYYGF